MRPFRRNPSCRPKFASSRALMVMATLLAFRAEAKDMIVKGAILPPGSQPVGENRFRSPSNYVDTLAFYGKQYKNNPRKTIVNQPGIRAVHIVNDGKGDWEGLNIYERDDETRIFVVPKDLPAPRVNDRGGHSEAKTGKTGKVNRQ